MLRTTRALLLLGLAPAGVAAAQDVEMLGERYGTPVPESYRQTRRADPDAFRFMHGLRPASVNLAAFEGAASGGPSLVLGPREGPVEGTFVIPVVLGMYSSSGSTPPFSRTTIQNAYFTDAPGTISDYYTEVSGGRVTLDGDVFTWVQTARPNTDYTDGRNGLFADTLGGGGAGNFVWELVRILDEEGMDWGQFDNDGPDGDPNSGDDDGYVDILAVVQPSSGGECGGFESADRIWSHRWTLSSAITNRESFRTSRSRTGGDVIRIDDYIIQPAISCVGGGLNEIGVFTHELGHAFGLPDLYDTCDNRNGDCPDDADRTSGAGTWDLMASGSWGCDNNSPDSPCHMGAWSKAMLGWADVVTLGPDLDHGVLTLPPVHTGGTVYQIDAADGSDEYFLLENRQRAGYDANLYAPGLLVWQIDPDWVMARWPWNRVNANAHQGVWLRQADGKDDLGAGTARGDAGDPFPGSAGNGSFHTVSNPGAISFEGGVTGLTIVDIAASGQDVELRLSTRFSTVTVSADGASGSPGLLTVDGQELDGPETMFTSAPFVEHVVEASVGESLAPGERVPFEQWLDDPSAARERTIAVPMVDSTFVASYGGTQFELTLALSGGVNGVEPATFSSIPASGDFWFEKDAEVTLEVLPRTGFVFDAWSGAAEGQTNPATLTMATPMSVEAAFTLVYAISAAAVELPAAMQLQIQLEVEHGTPPVRWTLVDGSMPVGTTISSGGTITGAALELGRFDFTVEAVDGIGLPATAQITLDVAEPSIPIAQLASTFLLSGPRLSDEQINFLNLQGNRIAPYDIGDFRAWVLGHPSLPLSADVRAPVHRRTVVVKPTGDPVPDSR